MWHKGVKSKARIVHAVHAGVPQCSKLSPSFFSYYTADMPQPTRGYAMQEGMLCRRHYHLGHRSKDSRGSTKINDYLKEMSFFLKANSLLILFTPDPAQAHYHPAVMIEGSRPPLERSPKLLGVYLDTFFSSNYHCGLECQEKKQSPECTGRHKLDNLHREPA